MKNLLLTALLCAGMVALPVYAQSGLTVSSRSDSLIWPSATPILSISHAASGHLFSSCASSAKPSAAIVACGAAMP